MIILYVLLVAYILAINFYAFLLVKSLRDQERQAEIAQAAKENATPLSSEEKAAKPPERIVGKLCIAGLLGGAITIYVCMFLFKYKRNDLLLMVLMPLLGVLNIYLWVILFKSGFSFFIVR